MAGNARSRGNHRQQGVGLPGWMMLSIGVGLGFLIATLVYFALYDDADRKSAQKKPVKAENTEKTQSETSLPRFEFYSILPELEVVIPEQLADSLREVLEPTGQVETAVQSDADAERKQLDGAGDTYFIQAGSFKKIEDAERMKIKLLLLGLDVGIKAVAIEGVKYHRVRIGPLANYDSFELARKRLKENDIQFLVLKSREQ